MIVYGVDTKDSKYSSNKKRHIYVLGKSGNFIQGLQYGTRIYPESDYNKVNASKMNVNLVLSIHYNGNDSYLFINGVKQFQFKAMDKLNLKNSLLIGNVTTDFEKTSEYDKTSLKGDIYDLGQIMKKQMYLKYMIFIDI